MKTPFIQHEDTFYVAVRATGIHPLIPYIDGMTITLFPKCRTSYLRLDEAIAWHENEIRRSGGTSGNPEALRHLLQARDSLRVQNAHPERPSL